MIFSQRYKTPPMPRTAPLKTWPDVCPNCCAVVTSECCEYCGTKFGFAALADVASGGLITERH